MRKLATALLAAAGVMVFGSALADLTVKDGGGVTRTLKNFVCETTKLCSATVLIKSDGTEIGTSSAEVFVGGRGTAGSPAGGVLTVQGSASGTAIPVSLASVPSHAVTVASGGVASGAYASGAFASGSFSSGAFASGSYASGAFAAGSMVDLLTIIGSKTGGTAATSSALAGCVYNTSAPTLTNGQQAAVQCDVNGNPKVSVVNTNANGQATMANSSPVTIASNQSANALWGHGATGASVPANATYMGFNSGGNLTGPSTSTPLPVRAGDGTRNAIIDPCEANLQSYAPISVTTATTTRIVTPSASNKTYICGLILVTAAANNVGIVEGTGGTCGSGTAGVIGGTTAANGPNYSANGGMVLQAGKVAQAQTAGTNVDLCLITSAATPLAGGIKYVQAP